MPLRPVFLFLVAILTAGAVQASSVTIDFTSGSNVASSSSGVGGPASGTWQQSGFNVDWSMWDYYDTSVPTNYTGFTTMGDGLTGFESGRQMTLTRAGGGSFSLDSLDTSWSYEGYYADTSFTPFAADGSLDFAASTSFTNPILRPTLSFSGVTSSGSTVSAVASVTSAAAFDPTSGSFGPSQASFAPGVLASLSDLTSLTISVGTNGFFDVGAAKALIDFGAPSEILQGLSQCGFNSCTIPGVGQFDYSVQYFGMRNDTAAATISGITLSTNGPAAVPLPASAVLLLGGLMLLGANRARRRA